ncbi:hypothetical protein BCR33DRAFT_757773 [Rhizoclosmatium globosum]|uniref:Clavaminate synthase-like protein n=1 Tax=Rhizoclosmatium globosum TaxID=329046 RepID=A0A1Y2CII9_9FUNG|nr:hypothetical protein BCR33DRAFT_757773 [Rhizoclosmatium globosum]|eukprot:ORY46863.1 hypothetical protein BCR33DRAFT_757773 [Rhizoclosmatium globosum]
MAIESKTHDHHHHDNNRSNRNNQVSEQNNTDFLDLMEDYFDQPTETKLNDARPEIGFQVGSTPDNTELPRCGRDDECLAAVADMAPEDQPGQFDTPDPKWRFFHRMGEVPPYETKFPALNAAPVVPAAFPNWVNDMDKWGNLLLTSVDTLSEMVAVGFGLPKDTFTKLTKYAPHLLAPTGSDLSLYGKVGTVLAGFHADLNFLTIHGKSRFPGLHIWTRAGKKMLASVADGCLLVQAVLIVESTLKAIERQQAKNRPLWRISSTLFYHVASDNELAPLEKFATPENVKQFPPILTGTQVQKELGFLNLASE